MISTMEKLSGKTLQERKATVVSWENIDQAVVVAYPGPDSYTGEDVVEIFCHGNPIIVKIIQGKLLSAGLRSAEPGEFTMRAVANGKMDLVQAEAVDLMVRAGDPGAVAQAYRSLSGEFSEQINAFREDLLSVLSRIQASIEFPEDQMIVDREGTKKDLEFLAGETKKMTERIRVHWKDHIPSLIIAGPPNTGKSTLFNALLGWERAIVTPVAGTTRDQLRETFDLGGIQVRVVDTAGLRDTKDELERHGVERAKQVMREAQAMLFVVDPDTWSPDVFRKWESCGVENRMLVWNKTDLGPPPENLPEGHIAISALDGTNLNVLIHELERWTDHMQTEKAEFLYMVTERQERGLKNFLANLEEGIHLINHGGGEEEVEFVVKSGIKELENLIGILTPEDVLDHIFSRFCLGK